MKVRHMRGRYYPTKFSGLMPWAIVAELRDPICIIDVRAVPTNKALAPYWKVREF
jgi:hypothetical protein